MPNSRSKIISPLRLLLALMPGHIHAEGLTFDPWTREDTYRQAALTGLVVMDWRQTLYVAKHTSTLCFGSPNNCADYLSYHEDGFARNFIGTHPSVGKVNNYFAASIIAHATMAYILPTTWRHAWQYFWIGLEVNQVERNRQIGIGTTF